MTTPAPGPRGGALLGSLPEYKRDPVHFMLRLQEDYGDVARFRLGPYLAHLVTHPEGVRHVIAANDRNYCRGRFYEKFRLFFGDGLLTLDGDAWKGHRHVAQPAFMRGVITRSTDAVVTATRDMLERWEQAATRGEDVALVPEAMGLTLASLSRTLFGFDVSDEREPIGRAVDFGVRAMFNQGTVAEMLPQWLPTARNRGIRRNRAVLESMVERIRREHRNGDAVVDLVDLFESATDETGTAWSAQEIHDELVTVFLAGQETTALALCWALAAIAQHPHVRDELEAEVDRVVGPDVLTEAHLPELGYTRMVVEETLRLYPPIWLYTRDALEDDEILGHPVPAGTSVLVSPLATHRRPDLWPDPTRFDPQRFAPEQRKGRHRFAYFPFGGGPRQCIGMHLALHELQIMVAMVAGRFRLQLRQPVEIGAPVLSLRPLGDVGMRLELREPAPAPGARRS